MTKVLVHYRSCLGKTDYRVLGTYALNKSSDVHFRRSPVIDQLKSYKTDCSNTHQDLGQIKIQFWWSHIPFFTTLWTVLAAIAFPPKSSLRSAQNTDVLARASQPQGHHVLAKVSSHVYYLVKVRYAD